MKINNNLIIKASFLSLIFLVAVFASSPAAFAQTKMSKHKVTTVTMDSARTTALKHASGTVEREEMETQNGKSVYAFDIRNSKGATHEVWVDTTTGRVIKNAKKSSAMTEQNKVAYSKKKTKH